MKKILNVAKETNRQATWVTKSVKRLTPDSGSDCDLRVVRLSSTAAPHSGCSLLEMLSLPLSLHLLQLSISLV